MERPLRAIATAFLYSLSTPVKPGGLHRFLSSLEYEVRMQEFLVALGHALEAYRRGRELARGARDAGSLGLGHLAGQSIREAMAETGERPLPGLHVSLITISAAAGYNGGLQELRIRLHRILSTLLYGSSPEDAVELVEGLEAVGAREHVMLLDERGLTPGRIRLNAYTLGNVYEALESVDYGFLVNPRGARLLVDAAKAVGEVKSLAEASVRAYLELLTRVNPDLAPPALSLKALARYDQELRRKGVNLEHLNPAAGVVVVLSQSA
ncbi:MAG: hypothetical protein GSR78_03820 [Desulfurococcales archaeon]|nr:hypothetical protein [Desulfurococcales archaeon]